MALDRRLVSLVLIAILVFLWYSSILKMEQYRAANAGYLEGDHDEGDYAQGEHDWKDFDGVKDRITKSQRMRFLVIGDWGTNPDVQSQVAERMAQVAEEQSADFVISVGDNFYNTGVRNSSDPLFTEVYENVYSQPSLQIPWFISVGNHDSRGNVEALVEYAKKSNRWKMPARYYQVVWPLGESFKVRMVVLDTLLMICHSPNPAASLDVKAGDCLDAGTASEQVAQFRWLQRVLEKPSDFTVVVGHVPIYSAGHHLDTTYLVDELFPLFQKYRVDLYLSGHDHMLQHLRAMDDSVSTDLVVTGGGGFPVDLELLPNPNLVKGFLANGFVSAEITTVADPNRLKLEMEFIDINQEAPIYTFERTT